MDQKENRRIAQTRRLLQEALLRLLEHEKLEHIRVTALCKEAGINRATFYNHYASPVELLCEMEQQLVDELTQIAKTPASIEDVADQMEQFCIKLKENASLVVVLVHYHADRDLEDTVVSLAAHYSRNRLDMNKTHLDVDTTHLVSTFLFAGSYALIQEWLLRDIHKTPKEIAELVLSIVSRDYL